MRFFYSIVFYLALPYLFIRLLWRSQRLPAYRERLLERLGYYPFKLEKSVWVHAVSVGETVAAIPLIKHLQINYPHLPILVTTMTPTGAARVQMALGSSVHHAYIPYDTPAAVTRFLTHMNPLLSIIIETELWPNLIAKCRAKQIPMCLMNARLSEKSAQGYRRIASLTRVMLRSLDRIAAHGNKDAERFVQLGALKTKVAVTGNIKFDLELPPDLATQRVALRTLLGKKRFVWIAASTHEGEEEMILAAHKKIRAENPTSLLILVPRHPDRFDAVAKYCTQLFTTQRRSQGQACSEGTAIYLGDTMGELLLLYAVSDVAFVGGSLIPRGGHNLLEPAALMKPILTGPHLFNFAEISELFFSARALIKVQDANTLAEQLLLFMSHPQECIDMGQRAFEILESNRGALAKQIAIITGLLKSVT